MYKIFHENIKHFSLLIGYFNLLRSFYYGIANGDLNDKSYIISNQIIEQFKSFCKKMILEIEKTLENQNYKNNLSNKDLKEIKKLVASIPKQASQGMVDEIENTIPKIIKFIDFLANDFPNKNVNQVDLREIRIAVNVFKYQIYLC